MDMCVVEKEKKISWLEEVAAGKGCTAAAYRVGRKKKKKKRKRRERSISQRIQRTSLFTATPCASVYMCII